MEKFKQQINRVKDSETIPVVIVGNKCDKSLEREVSTDDGKQLAKKLGCQFGMPLPLTFMPCERVKR